MSTYHPRALVRVGIIFDGADEVREFSVMPRRADVERNDHRTADTSVVELDYRDFPIDPRTARQVLLRVWMGDVGSASATLGTEASQRMFIGYADDITTTLDESGEIVRFEARDYTGLFLDYRWPGIAIRLDQPLKRVVRSIMGQVPGASGIPLVLQTLPAVLDLDGPPLISEVNLSEIIGRSSFTPQDGDDAWTVLSALLGRIALIPVIEGDTLYVRTPTRTKQRTVKLSYGRDIERLRFMRKGGTVKRQPIQVVAHDAVERVTRTATFPEPRKGDTVLPFYVDGEYSQGLTEQLVRQVYEETSRQYVEGELSTREMRAGDVDLTQLANGDDVRVRLYPIDSGGLTGMSYGEVFAELTQGPQRLRPGVARAVARAWQTTKTLPQTFYVQRASHSWDHEDGYELTIGFINRVVVGA